MLDERDWNVFNAKKWYCLKKWTNPDVHVVRHTHTPWRAALWLGGRARALGPISVPKGRNTAWCPINMPNYGPIKINYLEKNRKLPTENLVVDSSRRHHFSSYEPLDTLGGRHTWGLTVNWWESPTTTQKRREQHCTESTKCIQTAACGHTQPRVTMNVAHRKNCKFP